MKQITWSEAEKVAAEAAERAMGFPHTWPKDQQQVDDVRRVATSAAVIALREVGHLAQDDRRSERNNARLAAEARARHRAWCQDTGHKF